MTCRFTKCRTLSYFLSGALMGSLLCAQNPVTASSTSAPSGTFAVESQTIAYEALNELAVEIQHVASRQAASEPGQSKTILLATPTNVAAVGAFFGFKTAAENLALAYEHAPDPAKPKKLLEETPFSSFLNGAVALSPFITALNGSLSAVKGQTTQSSNSFTPVDQALSVDLERAFAREKNPPIKLVTTAYPEQLQLGSMTLSALVLPVLLAREKRGNQMQKDNLDPQTAFKDLDTQLSSLLNSMNTVSTGSPVPLTLLGAALLNAIADVPPVQTFEEIKKNKSAQEVANLATELAKDLFKQEYKLLYVSIDAAGGGVRANQYFLINIFYPAPHPSYNGGAVVSYSLRSSKGSYLSAQTLRFVFGYSKWKQPGLHKHEDEEGFANFNWKKDNGRWGPVY